MANEILDSTQKIKNLAVMMRAFDRILGGILDSIWNGRVDLLELEDILNT